MNEIKNFSLMTALLSVINDNETEDVSYAIAHYLLEHFHELDALSIYDILDHCYVSRSGVRRFCRSIGYSNFSDIKARSKEWNFQYEKYLTMATRFSMYSNPRQNINQVLDDIEKVMSEEIIGNIVDVIHRSKRVFVVVSEFSGSSVKQFQQSMAAMGKIIRVMTSSYIDENSLKQLDVDDALITISITGNYALQVKRLIEELDSERILFTLNKTSSAAESYDEVIYFGEDQSMELTREYSMYGVDYLFDLIFSAYVMKYHINKELPAGMANASTGRDRE